MLGYSQLKPLDAALIIVALSLVWTLYRAHKDKNGLRHFNLFDLIMENGRVSRLASVFIGGTLVVSWIMVRLTLDGKMTEGYLGLYFAGVITPIVTKLFSPPPAPGVKTVEESKKTTTTVEAT